MKTKVTQGLVLSELVEVVEKHLSSLNYSKHTLRHLNECWSKLRGFAKKECIVSFTPEFAERFLRELYGIELYGKAIASSKQHFRRALHMLIDYQSEGKVFRRRLNPRTFSKGYAKEGKSFMDNMEKKLLSKTTLKQFKSQLIRFTSYLNEHDVMTMQKITAKDIEGYFSTYIGLKKCTIAYAASNLKAFFKYAVSSGFIKEDLSIYLPVVKVNYRNNLPSVFTTEEIEKILNAVDRGNPKGKRDYAILLLAIRYGMRGGDIIGLKLNNLDFELRKITYTQSKTGNLVRLDILETVGWALIDYLKNARPNTDCDNVFIRLIAPYNAFSETSGLDNVLQNYLCRAQIKRTPNRHYGIHTFRHSLASHLLQQGNPLHTISKVLDHAQLNSTMIYTKIDLPQLSLCALEVPL